MEKASCCLLFATRGLRCRPLLPPKPPVRVSSSKAVPLFAMVTCTSPFRHAASYAALSSGAHGVPKELLHFAVVPARAKATKAGVGVLAPHLGPHRMAEFDPSGIDYHGQGTVAERMPCKATIVVLCFPTRTIIALRSWLRRRPT